MILDKINKTGDIKNVSPKEYTKLAQELRHMILNQVSVGGGHLASNLGAVELTMALHIVLDLPKDKIIWDVGHQSYTHKILTGRKNEFSTLRQMGGISGFPRPDESDADCFATGHSSTSVSAGLGMVEARRILKDLEVDNPYRVVSVIGDGAMTGGLVFEAINNVAKLNENFLIILNDNEMSISENVGGLSRYLDSMRTSQLYLDMKKGVYGSLNDKNKSGREVIKGIRRTKNSVKQLIMPGMYFEDMGITYLGPVDGHNTVALIKAIKAGLRVPKGTILHVYTQKGRGFDPAIKHPARFHGIGAFDIENGVPTEHGGKADYTDVFSSALIELAANKKYRNVVAITAAMADGVGLKRFKNIFPERFFDVGIAEAHAVTFAAGLASCGLHPVVAVYSSFLQRAYDQILHDVCLQKLPVIFAIDRAGLVGADGHTHQGIFDVSFLSSIPDFTLAAPKNKWELADMLRAACDCKQPIGIRYPRGQACDKFKEHRAKVEIGKAEILLDRRNESEKCKTGKDEKKRKSIALFAIGAMVETAYEAASQLSERGFCVSVVNMRFYKPIDEKCAISFAKAHDIIATLEDNVVSGGLYASITQLLSETDEIRLSEKKLIKFAVPDSFIEHASVTQLREKLGLDRDSIVKRLQDEGPYI